MRELIENAGIFAWPLGLCSLLATIIIIERLFALRKSSIIPRFYEVAFSTGSIPEHGDAGSVAGRILDYFHQGKLDAEQLKAYTPLQVTRMERVLFILEIVVSAATLTGFTRSGLLCGGCVNGPYDHDSWSGDRNSIACIQQLPEPAGGYL